MKVSSSHYVSFASQHVLFITSDIYPFPLKHVQLARLTTTSMHDKTTRKFSSHKVSLASNTPNDGVLREDHRGGPGLRPAEPREQHPDQKRVDEETYARLQAQHRQHDPAGPEEIVVGPVPHRRHGLQGKQEPLTYGRQLQVATQGRRY